MRIVTGAVAILLGLATPGGTNAQQVSDFPPFEKSADEIRKSADGSVATATRILDEIAALDEAHLSFAGVFVKLDDVEDVVAGPRNRFEFFKVSHPDETIRTAAEDGGQKIETWSLGAYNREDVYASVKKYLESSDARIKAERDGLSATDKRLVELQVRRFKRNGLFLPKEKRAEVVGVRKDLLSLTDQHRKNYNAESWVVFTKAELEGVPADVLSEIRYVDGMYHVRATAAETSLVFENAPLEATRKKALTARYVRGFSQNAELATRIVRARARLAKLFDNASWVEYQTEPNMLSTPARVGAFLNGVDEGLTPHFRRDLGVLDRMKAAESKNPEAHVASWDVDHFNAKRLATEFQVDLGALRAFFEYDHVVQGMLAVYSRAFGLTFTPVVPPYKWHEDVRALAVADAATGRLLGIAYLDMFPREGKRDSFSEWQLTPGKRRSAGDYTIPVAALLANFPKKTGDAPVLLDLTDVKTLFHEFGHVLHELLGHTDYALMSGTNVEPDFVEAPSVMMESFVTDGGVLKLIAYNPADPARPFPADVIPKLKASEACSGRMSEKRQYALAKIDQAIYTSDTVDAPDFNLTAFTDRVMADVFLASPEATSFVNTFRHTLTSSYDGTYYQYVWAAALAADLVSVFEASRNGFLDPEIGMRYRREILEPGGARPAMVSVERFLGRPFDERAYLKRLGGE